MQFFYDLTFIDCLIVALSFAVGFGIGHFVFPWLFGDRSR